MNKKEIKIISIILVIVLALLLGIEFKIHYDETINNVVTIDTTEIPDRKLYRNR